MTSSRFLPILTLLTLLACDAPRGELRASPPPPPKAPPTSALEDLDTLPEWPTPESERWRLQAKNLPDFPWLPGEDPTPSRSVGTTSEGYLFNAHQLRFPMRHLAILDVQSRRLLNFTSDEVARILTATAKHVSTTHPGAIVYLGNLGKNGGGDIPYSISHNSGRDADIAFFVTDLDGNPALMPNLLPLDETGRYEGPEGTFLFDVPRNWTLVEGLLRASGDSLQVLFVADWLRDQILAHAATIGADPGVLARARSVMQQPRASLPHNDHFHLRVFCSARDRAAGCANSGYSRPWRNSHTASRTRALALAKKTLAHAQPEARGRAIRRLVLMRDRTSVKPLGRLLTSDPSPLVRASAARARGALGASPKPLGLALQTESSPEVLVEIIAALGQLPGSLSATHLTDLLTTPKPLGLSVGLTLDARMLATDALSTMEERRAVPGLLSLLPDPDPEVRARAARALRMTTNHQLLEGDWASASEPARMLAIESWKAWYKKNRKKPRDLWLATGFQAKEIPVSKISKKYAWEITRAITASDHLSYNAQRSLMRLVGRKAATLSWSKADASFWWRRWLERRRRRLGLSKPPLELSTLQPKK